jgi:hypothetical protein
VSKPERRSRIAASILALLTAVSIWLSLGILAVTNGDASRIAVFPSSWILAALVVVVTATAWLSRLRLEQAWPLALSLTLWLPFLPGTVPAALLIWQGPIEAVVWTMVIAGLIAARPSIVPRTFLLPSAAPWIAMALCAAASLVAFSQLRNVVPGGDEPHYLAATQSLLHDGDLKVANNYANGDYLEYFAGRLEPHFLKRSTTGEIYSIHAPGVSAIILPAFAIAGYPGAVVAMVLFASLTAALTWRLAYRISERAGAAWIAVLSVFLTAAYFLHSFTIYPEIIGSCLVMIGISLLIDLSEGRDASDRRLCGTGLALAILPWLHSRFAVIAATLAVIIVLRLLQRSRARRRTAVFLAVPLAAAIGWFAFFYVVWGSPSPAAPYGADTSTSPSYVVRGLIGLLFDQQFGLVTTAPVYLMAAVGIYVLFLRNSRLAVELMLIVIPYSLAVASYQMWWAGNAAPARFLVAILPLAALPIALVGTRAGTIALMVVSIAMTVPRVFTEGGRFIFNNRGNGDATIDWITRTVDFSLALPSVLRDGEWTAARDAAVWIVIFSVAGRVAAGRTRKMSAATRFAAMAMSGVLTVIAASSLVWRLHQQPVITPQRSILAALSAYRPSWHAAPPGFLDALAIAVPRTTRINRLPAGEYRLMRDEPWQIVLARNDRPLAVAGDRLRIPVMLQSPTLVTAGQTLVPAAVITPMLGANATHAAQYGSTRVYAFDERVYLEADGFWTRGHSTATVVVDAEDRAGSVLPLLITAPAATTLRISSEGIDQRLAFDAGQQRTLTLPSSTSGIWAVTIVSGDGVRPSEREPGNTDVRLLAAWISLLR